MKRKLSIFVLLFLVVLGFELWVSNLPDRTSTTWVIPPAWLSLEFYWDRFSQAMCPGWLWTLILLIFAPQVARMTGMTDLWLGRNYSKMISRSQTVIKQITCIKASDSGRLYSRVLQGDRNQNVAWTQLW
jgi:hypothetical protein